MNTINQRGSRQRRAGMLALVIVSMLLGGLIASPMAAAKQKQDPDLNFTYYLTHWGMERYCESQGGILIENEHLGPNSGAYVCVHAWTDDVILHCGKDKNPDSIWRYFCINADWFAIPAAGQEPTAPPPLGELAEPDRPEPRVVSDASHTIIMNGVAEELSEGSAEPDHGVAEPATPASRNTVGGVSTGLIVRP